MLIERYDLTKTDFKDVALKVKAFKPDLMFLSGFQSNLIALIPALTLLKLLKPGNAVASYDMIDALPLLPAASIEGLRVTAPTFMVDGGNTRFQAWKADFTRAFGRPPLYTHAYAFDFAMILADVCARLPVPWYGQDVVQALRATDYPGVTGRLRFDADGDLAVPVELAVIHNGLIERSME